MNIQMLMPFFSYVWVSFSLSSTVCKYFIDIYLVREMKLWKLEEDLMAKLIYLYRSPETMLPFTKLRPHKPKHKTLKQE